MTKRWYVVHAYSGMEKSVARALQERVDRAGMQDSFGKILVPTEEVVEMKNGQRTITERRFFPGYVLAEMDMTDDTWHLVKSTNKVTGFVGGQGNRPAPISEKEVEKIMAQMQEGVEKPRPKVEWTVVSTEVEALQNFRSMNNNEQQAGNSTQGDSNTDDLIPADTNLNDPNIQGFPTPPPGARPGTTRPSTNPSTTTNTRPTTAPSPGSGRTPASPPNNPPSDEPPADSNEAPADGAQGESR